MAGRITLQEYQEYLHLRTLKQKSEMENYYIEFFRRAWEEIEPGTDLQLNWHMIHIAHVLQEEVKRIIRGEDSPGDIIFNVPPGTSKSSLITKLLQPWAWLQDPSMRIITSSYSGALAIDHAVISRDLIAGEWYQKMWGDKYKLQLGRKRKSQFENNKMGIRSATSVGGRGTGMHADVFIIDDPLNPKQANSEVEIQKPNVWWDRTLTTRLRDQRVSVKIIVMQRLHEDDLTGHVLKKAKAENLPLRHICLPATEGPNIQPPELRQNYTDGFLDPVRFPQKVLTRMKSQMGSLEYAGQMDQAPAPEEGNLMHPHKWFKKFTLSDLQKQADQDDKELTWDVTIDGAYTENTLNAPTALLSFCRYKEHTYIRDAVEVWMELPELLKFIPEFLNRNGGTKQSRIFIEPKASGMSAAQALQRWSPKLNTILSKDPKGDKVARVKSCLPYMEAGKVHTLQDATWEGNYYGQLKTFPNSKYKDLVDVTTMAIDQEETEQESFYDFTEIG